MKRFGLTIFAVLFLTACGDGFNSQTDEKSSVSQGTPNNPEAPDLKICSTLNFDGVRWSERFDTTDHNAFALALNISSSYEGHAGWENLTNNFDGQGLSMGLLNQTLGTGSLQPLLYYFRKDYPTSYRASLTGSQKSAMDSMLNAWAQAKGISLTAESVSPFNLVKVFTNDLPEDTKEFIGKATGDIDKYYAVKSEISIFGAAETASVNWALNNIYTSRSGTTFKSEWKSALKKIAGHPDYIGLQIEAAEYLHDRALSYVNRAGFTELRAYLMLFDIAVQNGSIRSYEFDEYFTWRNNNPNATEKAAQLKLADIRASNSNSQWQADVRSRKFTIVNGTGVVHGENRNLPQEYCYEPTMKYPLIVDNPN